MFVEALKCHDTDRTESFCELWVEGTCSLGAMLRLGQARLHVRLSRVAARKYTGFVGAGNMGRGMVLNIAKKGGKSVRLFDVYKPNLDAVAALHSGITAASSLADLASGAEVVKPNILQNVFDCLIGVLNVQVVVVSVAGEAAEAAVLTGDDAIFANVKPGAIVINCGTNTVSFSKRLHEAAAAKGIKFIDAPVSGGPEGAANGTLTIMCGGSEESFAAAHDVLHAMGTTVVRMGSGGTGSGAKLVNQLLTAANANAAAEGNIIMNLSLAM